MRISFMGPDVFPRQMSHLGSSPGTPAEKEALSTQVQLTPPRKRLGGKPYLELVGSSQTGKLDSVV